MLQWFGNLVMEMPVGLPVVAQGGEGGGIEGGVTAGATCDRRLMGKHHFQTPTSNLLIINQQEEITPKNHIFYSKGHLNRKNGFHLLLLPPNVENTLVSIRLKEVLPMLHLSLPIVNSVDPFLLRVKMPVFVYLLVSLFVHACQPRSSERNECL